MNIFIFIGIMLVKKEKKKLLRSKKIRLCFSSLEYQTPSTPIFFWKTGIISFIFLPVSLLIIQVDFKTFNFSFQCHRYL